MKKKVLSLAMCLMMAGGLAACGGSSSSGSAAASSAAASSAAAESETAASSAAAESTASTAASGTKDFGGAEVTVLWVSNSSMDGPNAVVEAAEKALNIKVSLEQVPGGEDGDNVVKTRLASGDMADLLSYNCGALLATLNPSEYFEDITADFKDELDPNMAAAASVDDVLYGIPVTSSQAGAVLYNKEMYEKYNLEVPKTWDDFLANCKVLQDAGETAILGTDGDSWTSQVTYLGDEYNVEAAEPSFPDDFTAGTAKYATTPAALKSFQKIQDTIPFMNSDHMATTYDDGCDMMANGEAAHWIILTSALSNMNELYGKEALDKIGCFGIPGDDADNTGLTIWEPNAMYLNKNSQNKEAAEALMQFWISKEGLDTLAAAEPPVGPYVVADYDLPDDVYPAVKDMGEYIKSGKNGTALEFKTAVKGSNCASICQELASGQTTAEEAAAKYDEDCKKQAMQLGLDWK